MRYRIEQKGHPYRYVKSVASALKVLVERYPGYRDHVGQFRRALRAGQAAVVVGSSVELLKIVPCKDLAPCPKCGQPMPLHEEQPPYLDPKFLEAANRAWMQNHRNTERRAAWRMRCLDRLGFVPDGDVAKWRATCVQR